MEFSTPNVEFLKEEVNNLSDSWRPFWDVISPAVGGRDFEWARQELKKCATVVQGNLFVDLPINEFDIGTMHFVAESLTTDRQEVRYVMRNFMRSLRRMSPFALSNMEGSHGYWVGDIWYPAAEVTVEDVSWMLDLLAYEKQVEHIDVDGPSVHVNDGQQQDDYTGYILSTGVAF